MPIFGELSGKALLEFFVANRASILEASVENILADIREIMQRQSVPGERLLGLEFAWDACWDCIGIDDQRFINTDDEFAEAPETIFRVDADGALSGGPGDLAQLRQAISECLEDVIETLREVSGAGHAARHMEHAGNMGTSGGAE
jgi:hypothetical protein